MDDQDGTRRLAAPAYPDDRGEAPVELAAALAGWREDPARYVEVLAALTDARLLVPVVALLGEVEIDASGLARDKTSDMASVLLTGADGRAALLAFTSMTTLQQWDADARPVPVEARVAAQAALQDGAAAMVLDVAGPVTLVVQGEDLRALAGGWTLTRVGEHSAWIRPGTP
ncbi:MAG: SseB family protein [Nocardioides sp.]|nr:SseB family protein [Nocardioides sp.]